MSTNNEAMPPKTAEEVRKLLVQKRITLNLSQNEMARLVGTGANSTISRIENGHQGIPPHKVAQFAKAYDLSEETLQSLTSSVRCGRGIGKSSGNTISDFDVLPLIRKIAASNREKLTAAELNTLITGYCAFQKSVEDINPELRDLLLSTLNTEKSD